MKARLSLAAAMLVYWLDERWPSRASEAAENWCFEHVKRYRDWQLYGE